MNRIMIIGPGGAGKSTLARTIGEQLNLPVFHLDAHMWQPNWVMTPRHEQRVIQERLLTADRWVIDGNYSSTMDLRIAKADTIIFLDINHRIALYQAVKRYMMYRNQVRPDMGVGCHEKIDWEFIRWIWNYPKNQRPKVMSLLGNVSPGKEIIFLKSPKQIEQFVQNGLNEHGLLKIE